MATAASIDVPFALCRDSSREIVYITESPLRYGTHYLEHQQWLDVRDQVGRICVGKHLGSTEWVGHRISRYGTDWVRCTEAETRAKEVVYQRAGLQS
jgi:hypothetical protein